MSKLIFFQTFLSSKFDLYTSTYDKFIISNLSSAIIVISGNSCLSDDYIGENLTVISAFVFKSLSLYIYIYIYIYIIDEFKGCIYKK